jgi:hypothetical protein
MNVEGITTAYSLSPILVSPMDWLLDPSNPRLITESSQYRKFSIDEICDVDTQEHVLELVCRKEHDVARLITSIRDMGFVGGLHEMIVKEVRNGGPYLVLEGNRRTAALRHLLARKDELRPDVRRSIEKVEVKLFRYKAHAHHDEQKVIDVLLGSIHIDGPKEWGALERANYIHRSYLRLYGETRPFSYIIETSREVGAAFNMSPKAVHKELIICRSYDQLRSAGVGVEPKHYSLLDLAIKTRSVAETYFEVDRNGCKLSELGIERFAELALRPKAPVHNPKLFDMFVEIYTDGTPLELEQLVRSARPPDDIVAAIRRRRERRGFREDLDALKHQIGALYVDDFRGTEGEKALIRKIREMVEKRLVPLLQGEDL